MISKLKYCKVMVGVSLIIHLFELIFLNKVSIFAYHVLKLNLKMVAERKCRHLNEIAQAFLIKATCLPHSALMLFKPLFLSLISFLRLIFMDNFF